MGCACGSSSAQSPAGMMNASGGSGNAYEYEVTYSNSTTQRFKTEAEAIAALSHGGGGYRQVPRA